MTTREHTPPALAWSWSHALLGAIYAVPAAVVVLVGEPAHGLVLAVGVLPAAAAGLPGSRRGRVAIVALGAVMGTCMVVGSVLAQAPVVAVPAVFALCLAAAVVAPRGPLGQVALLLGVPLIGIGLSYDDPRETVAIALLMVLGSVYAFLVALLWPTRPAGAAARSIPGGRPMLGYGVRLGLAGSCAAAIGLGMHLDHVGWVCGAALMVMRPLPELVRMRGVDRVGSVLAGAAAATGLVLTAPPAPVLAVGAATALAALAATRGSRRYVTPLFTTFLVLLMLLVDSPQEAAGRFLERMGETVLGVAIALVFGLAVPALLARRAAGRPADGNAGGAAAPPAS